MENKSILQSQSSLGFFGITRESFKTINRNGRLLGPILFSMVISFSQLDFPQKNVLGPVFRDLLSVIAKHSNMVHDFTYNIDQTTYVGAQDDGALDNVRVILLDDVRVILLVDLLIMAILAIITLVFVVVTVSSSSEAYIAKPLGPKDIFLKLKKSWKRPLVTTFYMTVLTLGLSFLYVISICVTSILAVDSWTFMFLGAIILSIPVCYFYVAALWMVSVIVSVLEEGSSGLKAIGRAAEITKGKRIQAAVIMALFTIAFVVVVLIAKALTSYNRSSGVKLSLTITFTNGFFWLLNLFMFVFFTIFYHEQKAIHDEKEGKGFYIPIAAGEA